MPLSPVIRTRGVRCSDHLGLLQDLFHRLVARNDLASPAFVDLGRARHFQRALDRGHQFIFVDGFGQEAKCAALRRRHRVRNRAVCGDDDDAQSRRARLQLFQQPDAVHLVHAQVGDDQVRAEAVQHGQRLVRGFDGFDFVTFGAQPNTQQAQQSGIVIDEQDLAFAWGFFGWPSV